MRDQIFYILLQEEHIRLLDHHVMPSYAELKGRAYCKLHSLFSHSTRNCNMFGHHQLQSAINERRSKFLNSQYAWGTSYLKNLPKNTINFENKRVLIRPE